MNICKGCLRTQTVVFLSTCGEIQGMWELREHTGRSSKVEWPFSNELKNKSPAVLLASLNATV